MAEYELILTDASGARLAQIDHYLKLDMRLVFNGVGKWLLDLPGSGAGLFAWGRRLLVRRDGIDFFSGPMFSLRHSWEAGIGTERDEITVSGFDDAYLLQNRVTWPEVAGNFYTQAYDVRTGACETVLKQYVNYNLGPGAVPPRRAGITIETDTAKGSTVTGRARWNDMLPFLIELAEVGGGLGFRMVSLQFQVYQPADKTATVKFSKENGTLAGYEYEAKAPTGNHCKVLGGGEGTARTICETSDPVSIVRHGRIEMTRDRRDTTDTLELDQSGRDELAARQESLSLALTPRETLGMSAYTDWWLGDKVAAVVDDQIITEVIREISVALTYNKGEVIMPIVGTSGAVGFDHPLMSLLEATRNLNLRMTNQERR
uniref:Gp28/Gp37-like domain-containing protein n=1 Tax=viral metagenome TaxID=1070528 RepID=A0A6H1ZEG9_9ZZZZ